jgi:ATP-binding cassette subfamily B protein
VASIIQQSAASQKRINEFLKTKVEILHDNTIPAKTIEGEIEFKNVSFIYPDTGIHALKNVSFKLKKGEKIAIVGRTGSGKTTIADLMLRMYDITEGQIFIDGIDIKKHNLSALREQTGYVPQDVFLFSDTVANNISFGIAHDDQTRIEEFARYAAVYDDIIALPEGFNTQIGERGITLSGGQKQRISIARALIKDPKIIILDDCLSAVDTKTEAEISSALKKVSADITTIIITHRLYSSIHFDKILVLEHGEMSAFGTHEELIANKTGYYYELYEKQHLEEV